MLDILVRVFVPGQLEIYLHINVKYKKSSSLLWTAGIPEFLRYRPPWFIRHCLNAMTKANTDYPSRAACKLEEVEVGVFMASNIFIYIIYQSECVLRRIGIDLQYRNKYSFRLTVPSGMALDTE